MDADGVVLTVEAKALLLEAVNNTSGQIMKIRTRVGTQILTNGKDLVPAQNARIIARWTHALGELIDNGFVEEKGYEGVTFAVTHSGYEYADALKKEVDVLEGGASGGSSTSAQQDDLKLDEGSGTYVSNVDHLRYCHKCLNASPSKRIPLQEGKYGWRCSVCDKSYRNPNRERQRYADNDYDRLG